jgi:dihydrofolate synthase / folylpolyglutamate synthase
LAGTTPARAEAVKSTSIAVVSDMDLDQALGYIHSTLRFGSRLGLGNMRSVLALMGDPQKQLRFIHIAGTNGKGSVVSFLSHALIKSGLLVGTYTSPYLSRFNERIKIGFTDISDDDLCVITEYVKGKIDLFISDGNEHPTEFEIVTCMAFEYFMRKKCDIVVLETGLGGRFDATNIVDSPLYCIITKIGFDHMEHLGNTLGKIAYEKAGIIKKGAKVFTYDQDKEALDVIAGAAEKSGCPIKIVVPAYELLSRTMASQRYRYDDTELDIQLDGDHQIRNSILAYEVLKDMGVKKEDIISGFKITVWAGRFEPLRKDPLFIIDGAHNADAVRELKKTIIDYFGDKKIIFIIGVFKDKDYADMIKEVVSCAKLFITVQLRGERALGADILADEIKKHFENVLKSDKISTAVSTSLDLATKDDIIIAFGSLSYIGEVKELVKNMEV